MPAPVARLGDPSNHGGTIISASPNVRANGIAVARHGDLHSCPLPGHGITAISSISSGKHVNGQRVLTVGAVAGCGAVISGGSPNVNSN